MDPELRKAFVKAIENYFKDDEFDRPKSMDKVKYNKKYFDDAQSKFFPTEEKVEKKVKKEVGDGI